MPCFCSQSFLIVLKMLIENTNPHIPLRKTTKEK